MTAPTRPRAVIVLSGPMTGLPDYNRILVTVKWPSRILRMGEIIR